MSLVTTGQRAFLRSLAARGFTDSVTVKTHTTEDTDQGMEDVWTTATTTKGWLRQMNQPGLDDMGESFIGSIGIYRLLLPFDTTVNVGDQVVIAGNTFIVQNTNSEDTNRVSLICSVRRLESD